MAFFEWEDRYRLGVDALDRQHERLVRRVNDFYEGMRAGEGREMLGETLDALLAYADTHFQTEEGLMVLHGYPDRAEHCRIHRRMREHVFALKARFDAGHLTSPVRIGNFLKNWLSKHILETDKRMQPFLRRPGSR